MINIYTLKHINIKVLLCNTENYIHYLATIFTILYNGKESEKEYIHLYLNHSTVHLKHNTVNHLYFNKKMYLCVCVCVYKEYLLQADLLNWELDIQLCAPGTKNATTLWELKAQYF